MSVEIETPKKVVQVIPPHTTITCILCNLKITTNHNEHACSIRALQGVNSNIILKFN
jgi:hypothetical protein